MFIEKVGPQRERTPLLLYISALIFSFFALAAAAGAEIHPRFYYSGDTSLTIGPYSFEGGKTLNLTVGIGSAAFRHPNDPADTVWTLSDRGPNIACNDMKAIAGVEPPLCNQVKNGRVYPMPSYAPSIYRVMLMDNGTFRVAEVITLKDRDGRPLNGLPNPLKTASTEIGLDGQGKHLPNDPNGIDPEGLIRLSDGTFWIVEENGPSLAHFAADGRMIVRYVPNGTESEFTGAHYDVKGLLPAILSRRAVNRGIEGLAVSPDERFFYFIMQNPLVNPDASSFRTAKNTRLFKVDRASMKIVGEYVYTLDDPHSFRRDPSDRQTDVRISELMAVAIDRLLVDERTDQTTKLYEIDLRAATNIIDTRWDEPATRPTLEQTELATANVRSVPKTLCLDSADVPGLVGKTEGMALLGDGSLVLINDNDFGISGERTQIAVVRKEDIECRW
jgi:hypothetical protein